MLPKDDDLTAKPSMDDVSNSGIFSIDWKDPANIVDAKNLFIDWFALAIFCKDFSLNDPLLRNRQNIVNRPI